MNPKDITKKPVKEKLSIFRRDEQGRIIVDDREEIKQLNKKNNELKIAQEQMDDLKKKNYLSLSPEDKEKVYEYNFEKICEKMQRKLSDEKLNEITDWFFLKILSLTIDEFGIKDKIIKKDMKNGLDMVDDTGGGLRKIRNGFFDAIEDTVWCVAVKIKPKGQKKVDEDKK